MTDMLLGTDSMSHHGGGGLLREHQEDKADEYTAPLEKRDVSLSGFCLYMSFANP